MLGPPDSVNHVYGFRNAGLQSSQNPLIAPKPRLFAISWPLCAVARGLL